MSVLSECQTAEMVQGVIHEVIEPGRTWRVKVYGVYWRASTLTSASFSPGERIRVVDRKSNTLLIAPI